MVKKIAPILFIIFIWIIFSKPFFIDNKIPFPSTLLVNHFSLWSEYPALWGPVKNPSIPDVVNQIMPWKKLTIETLKNGEIPLWNPYSFSGTPHLANYQSGAFSPTNLFFFIFSFNFAWGLSVLVQPLLSGIFMYLFIRSLKLSIWASLISAVSFMFCGFITVWMSYTTLSLAISFLPLALFSIEKFYTKNQIRFLVLLSVSTALSLFSGHFQTGLYFLIFVFAYMLFKFIEVRDKTKAMRTLIFTIFGILTSFPQILPSIELYKEAVRSTVFQKVEPVSIKYLPSLFAPDFYGNPVTRNNFFGNYIEWNIFLGTIPALLGLFSISSKTKKVIFFAMMGIFSAVFALNTPILDLMVNLKIPVLSTSSAGRVLVLFSFSFSVLAGFGLDQLISDIKKDKKKKIFTWFLFFGLIFSILWLFIITKWVGDSWGIALKNFILPTLIFLLFLLGTFTVLFKKNLLKVFLILLILLVAFDMLRFAAKWQPFDKKEFVFPKTPIISKLESLGNIDRVFGPYGAEGSVYFQIPGTEGYDPLYIGRYGEFLESLDDRKINPSPRSGVSFPVNAIYAPKAFDFLGIRYVLEKRLDKEEVWGFPFEKFANDKFSLIYREKDYFIYENKEAFPKAFLVGNYEVISGDQKIIDRILGEDFDLRTNAVLEKDPIIKTGRGLTGSAKIISYTPNKIIIETQSNKDAILVLSDNYYPGWHAKINGGEREVLRANYAFRGIAVSKGTNTIEMFYYPQSFRWGIIIALFGVTSIGILSLKWYTNGIKIRNKKSKSKK